MALDDSELRRIQALVIDKAEPENECEERLISIVIGDALPRNTQELRRATVALLQRVQHFEYFVDSNRRDSQSALEDIDEIEDDMKAMPHFYDPIDNAEKYAEQMRMVEEEMPGRIAAAYDRLDESQDVVSHFQDRLTDALSHWKHFEARYRNTEWILDEAAELVWAPESDAEVHGETTRAELSRVPLSCACQEMPEHSCGEAKADGCRTYIAKRYFGDDYEDNLESWD